ncbi:hypothetical protein [Pararobbsia silviterrae]|uniref:Copper-binding protein n=1 Tax=Pararobbsia silviterrae TaxID=1792498 RepID=A0A494XUK0_9BURK|nr:hypothetical protein [Pararobbsia silviterrae]RKP53381.1 hypothetical protein D7S86_16840 [Pararobbsia silviterrae]
MNPTDRRSPRVHTFVAVASVALACAVSAPAHADDAPPPDTAHAVQSGVVAHVVTKIVGIDADSNSVLIRGPRGNEIAVDVDPNVGNVADLKIGDTVTIDYQNALLVHADKVASNGIRQKIETDATTPVSGGESTSVRSVEVVATVEKIDRKQRLVTLRGPERTVVVQALPDVPLDAFKVGDSIRANFKSATAVKITRDGAAIQ